MAGLAVERLVGAGTRCTVRPGQAGEPVSAGHDIREFWDDRAKEDAFHFSDQRQPYRDPDQEGFCANLPRIDTFKPMTLDYGKAAARVEDVTKRLQTILGL